MTGLERALKGADAIVVLASHGDVSTPGGRELVAACCGRTGWLSPATEQAVQGGGVQRPAYVCALCAEQAYGSLHALVTATADRIRITAEQMVAS